MVLAWLIDTIAQGLLPLDPLLLRLLRLMKLFLATCELGGVTDPWCTLRSYEFARSETREPGISFGTNYNLRSEG